MSSEPVSISRRRFMAGLVAAGLSPQLLAENLKTDDLKSEVFVSAQGKTANQYGLGWTSAGRKNATNSRTGFRGHGASIHPLKASTAIMYARRPGNIGVEVDLKTGKIDQRFQCLPDHHLFGHGCFSADGKTLFTSEANYRSGEGKIGIRDSLTYQQLGEYDSHGIGPHEIKLMPDGKTLVIANGGLQTHPNTGRKTLNLATMQSSLTYLDLENGQKLDEFHVPEAKASIRHLDVAEDGTVAMATQVQREAMDHNDLVPLAAVHKPDSTIELLEDPAVLIHQMKDYMGSVAINNKTRIAGFTSPRGNVAAFWNMDDRQFVAYHALHDVCGLAVSQDQKHFVISNSNGELRFLDAATLKENKNKRLRYPSMHWDNHLLTTTI